MIIRETTMKRWDGAPCTEAHLTDMMEVPGHADFLAIVQRMSTNGEIVYRNVTINGADEVVVTVLFQDSEKCEAFEDEHLNLPWAKEMRRDYDITVTKASV